MGQLHHDLLNSKQNKRIVLDEIRENH